MDIFSYIIGLMKGRNQGKSEITLVGDDYTFADEQGNGKIVITEVGS